MEELTGSVDHIVFASEETGFTVAQIKVSRSSDLIPIVGHFPDLLPGEMIRCHGHFNHHPSYGRQFVVEQFDLKAPSDVVGIEKYLASGLIKGIGPVFAKEITSHFGTNTLEILENDMDRILSIPGIGKKRLIQIKKCWDEQKEIRNVMIFLRGHDVAPSMAQKIFKRYGNRSIEKVQTNPYLLSQEIGGIGFRTSDKIAENLGIEKTSSIRIIAGIEHALWEMAEEGHSCTPKDALIEKTATLLEVDATLIPGALATLEGEERVVIELVEERSFVWLRPFFLAEKGIARELYRIHSHKAAIRPIHTEKALEWIEKRLPFPLAAQQKEAIEASLSKKVHIITGGPGTGKSTITAAILSITSKITPEIVLAAPTGRAAKRLSEITRHKASTIHSLLEFDFQHGGFKKGKEDPLSCHLLIVDESSMIDTFLLYSLLKAVPSSCRLLFIGDVDQLPSVGAGNVLKDLLSSNQFSKTTLSEIFRQGKGSDIISNAHKINQGLFPNIYTEKTSDFTFIEIEDPNAIAEELISLNSSVLPKALQMDPFTDIQILSPMKRGVIGTENLNHLLQQTLNPNSDPLIKMGRRFGVKDKVMQIRNNYHKGVYNGDVGFITFIDRESSTLEVSFDGKGVLYDFSEMDELVLAYAVSIHKYQGSESPCIIMPLHISHFKLLHRNLLYTGITRGKRKVIVVGTKRALAIAVKNVDVKKRHTGLKAMLQEKKEPLRENTAHLTLFDL